MQGLSQKKDQSIYTHISATIAEAGTSHTETDFMARKMLKSTTLKHRLFRVVIKSRYNCVYFINTENQDDFYVYETEHFSSIRANKIYRESQLHIVGPFVQNILP